MAKKKKKNQKKQSKPKQPQQSDNQQKQKVETQQKQSKASRRDAARKQKQQQQNMRLGLIGLGVLLLGAFILWRVLTNSIEGVVTFPPEAGNQHDQSFAVEVGGLPPTNGVHQPMWQNCGIYDQHVAAEYGIHSLEHGAVWLAYNPSLPEDQVETLRQMARDEGTSHMLVSPYTDLAEPIAVSAWGAQLTVDSADDERIQRFINKYKLAAGAPESGASCAGSLGVPIE